MYIVYILQSKKNRRYYIGHTKDLEDRLPRHNSGQVKSTKGGMPWEVVYTEEYRNKSEAYRREIEIKKLKGGIKFKKLLGFWKE